MQAVAFVGMFSYALAMPLFSDTIAAGADSAQITTVPGDVVSINATLPVIVLARNAASNPDTFGQIYQGRENNESLAVVATSDRLVIRNPNSASVDVEVF